MKTLMMSREYKEKSGERVYTDIKIYDKKGRMKKRNLYAFGKLSEKINMINICNLSIGINEEIKTKKKTFSLEINFKNKNSIFLSRAMVEFKFFNKNGMLSRKSTIFFDPQIYKKIDDFQIYKKRVDLIVKYNSNDTPIKAYNIINGKEIERLITTFEFHQAACYIECLNGFSAVYNVRTGKPVWEKYPSLGTITYFYNENNDLKKVSNYDGTEIYIENIYWEE